MAEQQRVEIAKALAIEARIVIMDEPTATLTGQEIDDLFGVIGRLTAAGIAVLYISHRLEEIFRIADRVTVMRDGRVVDTLPVSELDEDRLIRLMVGREVKNLYPKPDVEIGVPLLRVEGMSAGDRLHDCSFEVRAGEILGFAGLVGAGRSELARAVFGADATDAGRVLLDGREVTPRSPKQGIDAGIGYLTEDRKGDGLNVLLSVAQNITLAHLPMRAGLIDLGTRGGGRERAARPAPHPHALDPPARVRPLRRQPAEGDGREVARDRGPRALLRRARAGHRRGRQGRDVRPHRAARARRPRRSS